MTAVAGAAYERLFTTWITSLDGVDHAVTDEECAARLVKNRGVFMAVCGAMFLPGAMESCPEPPCAPCAAFLRARAKLRDFPERLSPGRPGWLVWLGWRR